MTDALTNCLLRELADFCGLRDIEDRAIFGVDERDNLLHLLVAERESGGADGAGFASN